jgi:hypothetical protein
MWRNNERQADLELSQLCLRPSARQASLIGLRKWIPVIETNMITLSLVRTQDHSDNSLGFKAHRFFFFFIPVAPTWSTGHP